MSLDLYQSVLQFSLMCICCKDSCITVDFIEKVMNCLLSYSIKSLQPSERLEYKLMPVIQAYFISLLDIIKWLGLAILH